MTKYQEKILNLINNSTSHMTAEEIFLKLKEEEKNVVLATVYNNLNKLYENKMISKVSIQSQPDRYDKVVKHDHLVCRVCGEIKDFKFEDITHYLQQQLQCDIDSYDLKVNYICPKCCKKRS